MIQDSFYYPGPKTIQSTQLWQRYGSWDALLVDYHYLAVLDIGDRAGYWICRSHDSAKRIVRGLRKACSKYVAFCCKMQHNAPQLEPLTDDEVVCIIDTFSRLAVKHTDMFEEDIDLVRDLCTRLVVKNYQEES